MATKKTKSKTAPKKTAKQIKSYNDRKVNKALIANASSRRNQWFIILIPLAIIAAIAIVYYAFAATSDITINASADTYVQESKPDSSFRYSSVLFVNGKYKDHKITYYRFDVKGVGTQSIQKANLKIRTYKYNSTGLGDIYVLPQSWPSTPYTWKTRPSIDGALKAGSFGAMNANTWYTIPLSGVTWKDRTYIVAIVNPNANETLLSSIDGGYRSQLFLTPTATVTATLQAPVVGISATPSILDYSGTSKISWTTSNAPTSCSASGDWTGFKSASGGSEDTAFLTQAKNYTYSLTCTNAAGSATASTQVSLSAPVTRSKYTWPFASNSIWNMPLGADAVRVPAGLQTATGALTDVDRFYVTSTNDPSRKLILPSSWSSRCPGTTDTGYSVNFPDSIIVNDSHNNATAFLLPDGKTLIQVSAFARCTDGGPVLGRPKGGLNSIYEGGIPGGHGGSGLSSIGGTIRKGELTSTDPIRHVLKWEVGCDKYCSYAVGAGGGKGYRWPARNADGYASTGYHGTNDKLMMGTLLAAPRNVDVSQLNLQTEPAKKIYKALQAYGAYIVDDTAYDGYNIAVEEGVSEEVSAKYGFSLRSGQWSKTISPFYYDMMKIAQQLQIIDDNSSTNIGGAGVRLAPLAPPIGD